MGFLTRRLSHASARLLLLAAGTWLLGQIAPGDYFSTERMNPLARAETVDRWRHAEFGVSLAHGVPVTGLIAPRLLGTAAVAVPALVMGWCAGLALALWAAMRPSARLTRALEAVAATAQMVPDVIAMSLLLWALVWLGGPVSSAGLPIIALTLSIAPTVFLHASSAIGEALAEPFVRIARQAGAGERKLWLRYIMPAAANPLISLLGVSIAGTTGSSMVAEAIAGWPGLGPLFIEAVQSRDYPVVQAVVLLLGAMLIFSNLVADALLYRLDPRIRVPR